MFLTPVGQQSCTAALQAPDDLNNAIASSSSGSPGIFCVTSNSTSPAAQAGHLANGGKNRKAPSRNVT